MKRKLTLGMGLVLLASAKQLPAQDLPENETAMADPYQALTDAINPSANNQDQFMRILDAEIPKAMLLDPDIADLEDWCPGSIGAMMKGAEHIFLRDLAAAERQYVEGSYKIYAANLTKDEACGAADFYAGPLGSKIVGAAGQNMSFDNVMREAMSDKEQPISRQAVEKDQDESATTIMRTLSADERYQLRIEVGSASWGAKLNSIAPQLVQLRLDIENETSTSEEDEEMDAAMTNTLDPHIDQCVARDEAEE